MIDSRHRIEQILGLAEEFRPESRGLVGVEIGGAMAGEIVLDRRHLPVDPGAHEPFGLGLDRNEIELLHQPLHARPQHARPLDGESISGRAQPHDNLSPA